MNLLTDDEIEAMGLEHIGTCFTNEIAFAQALIAATVAKLSAGVSGEPVAWAIQGSSFVFRGPYAEIDAKAEAMRIKGTCLHYPLYTADAIAAARVQALEEAAIAADLFCNGGESQRPLKYPVADAIRALIGKEST